MTFAAQFASVVQTVLPGDEPVSPSELSTGFAGSFFVILGLAIVLFLLGYDLIRRMRRSRYRAEIQQELAAELAETQMQQAAEAGPDASTGSPTASTGSATVQPSPDGEDGKV